MAKITHLDEVLWDRLIWPDHKPRAARRVSGPFNKPEIESQSQKINAELGMWKGGAKYRISRNRGRVFAGDPGVALWWTRHDGTDLRVLACDQYDTQGSNLRAIFKTLNAMRALERWGAYSAEQAAEGAKIALPPPEGAGDIQWKAVFGEVPAGLEKVDALAVVNARYRRMAAESNGNDAELRRLNLAIEQARMELTA